jgi:hypothetical protein
VVVATDVVTDHYAVSGGATATDHAATAVWHDASTGNLLVRRLEVQSGLGIALGPVTPLAGSAVTGQVAMSRSGGQSGRQLVVYEVSRGAFVDIHGAILDRNLQIVDQGPILETADVKQNPAVDGDGQQWVVAFETSGNGIAGVPVLWNRAIERAWVGSAQVIAASPATRPAVAWLGNSSLVTYSTNTGARVASIDPFGCLPCEGDFPLSIEPHARVGSAIAAGGSDPDLALIATGRVNSNCTYSGTGLPVVRTYRARDGSTAELAGGCGRGGRARASCAVVGNQDFELGVWDGAANVPALLAISAGTIAFPCGGCTLRTDLGLGFALAAGNTDALGNAAVAAPLPDDPALIGGTIYEQWLLVTGTGCFGALELSTALAVTLE